MDLTPQNQLLGQARFEQRGLIYIEITAHTISQRLRTLKKIPIELLPLGG